jgi:hypothetical protein
MGSETYNTKGRNPLHVIIRQNCKYLSTGEPTYWATDPNKLADLLDFFILHGITAAYMQIESSSELSSDHSPMITIMSGYEISISTTPSLITKKNKWGQLRTYIEEHINLNLRTKKKPNELDEVIYCFTTLIQEAARYSTPIPKEGRKKADNIPFHIREQVT